jgi:hypothetical protein
VSRRVETSSELDFSEVAVEVAVEVVAEGMLK